MSWQASWMGAWRPSSLSEAPSSLHRRHRHVSQGPGPSFSPGTPVCPRRPNPVSPPPGSPPSCTLAYFHLPSRAAFGSGTLGLPPVLLSGSCWDVESDRALRAGVSVCDEGPPRPLSGTAGFGSQEKDLASGAGYEVPWGQECLGRTRHCSLASPNSQESKVGFLWVSDFSPHPTPGRAEVPVLLFHNPTGHQNAGRPPPPGQRKAPLSCSSLPFLCFFLNCQ